MSKERASIVGGMATVPEREPVLQQVLPPVLAQVDRLHLFLDGHDTVPPFVDGDPRIVVHRHLDYSRRLGDAGKFLGVEDEGELYFAFDDDLFYPPNYVEFMCDGLRRYDYRCLVSLHGGVMAKTPVDSYYRGGRRSVYRFLGGVEGDRAVNVAGSGVCALSKRAVRLGLDDFPGPDMADIYLALYCQRHRIPQVVLAHEEGFIKHAPIDFTETIYSRFVNSDAEQTRLVNSVDWLLLPPRGL